MLVGSVGSVGLGGNTGLITMSG